MSFVKSHTDEIRLLTKGFVDATHFFLTRKQETLEILKEQATPILKLQSDAGAIAGAQALPITGGDLECFSAGSKARPGDCGLQPLALWDTHFVREPSTIADISIGCTNKKGGA